MLNTNLYKFEEFEEKLNKVGKIESLGIYSEILAECSSKKNSDIYKYFDYFLELIEQYLKFDPNPPGRIKNIISLNFQIVFKYIRDTSSLDQFKKYDNELKKYDHLITDKLLRAKIYQYLGYLFWLIPEISKGIECLEESLSLINETGKVDEIPGRYTNIGYLYEEIGDTDKAEYYYSQGLNFAKKYNSQEALKSAYTSMGRLYRSRHYLNKAIQFFDEALSLYYTKENLNKVNIICNLAKCYLEKEDYKVALKLQKQIHEEWVKKNNPTLYFSINECLGVTYKHLKKYDLSENLLLESNKYFSENNLEGELCENYIHLSSLYIEKNENQKAFEILNKALELAKKNDNDSDKKEIFILLGNLLKKEKKVKKAISYFKKALMLNKGTKKDYENLEIISYLSECYEEIENYKKSSEYLKKQKSLFSKIIKEKDNKIIELQNNSIIGVSGNKHYLFKQSDSLIPIELTEKIGAHLIGVSNKMIKLVNQVITFAGNSDIPILIRGETGTGKELIAKLIHYSSSRAEYPFIAINSSSFTKSLASGSLFGHKKGSFTNAIKDQKGYFEAANKGTLFFDEIGDMPLDIQSSLLRVLEEKSILPIGANKEIKIDFRLVTATNIDIYKKVKNNEFRLDFLNRINVLEITIPPLRERREDIPLLINYYINDISNKFNINIKKIKLKNSFLKKLYNYDYPGNVRELKNIIERFLMNYNNNIDWDTIILKRNEITTHHNDTAQPQLLNLMENEKKLILIALKESNNVKTRAAELLGISIYALSRKLKKYGIVT